MGVNDVILPNCLSSRTDGLEVSRTTLELYINTVNFPEEGCNFRVRINIEGGGIYTTSAK